MPDFQYTAREASGAQVAGVLTAASERDALSSLAAKRLFPVRIGLAETEKAQQKTVGKRVAAKNLAVFTRQFSVMIDAGLPLVQCLDILGTQEEDKNFSQVILATRSDVEGGAALADAMRRHPKAFDARSLVEFEGEVCIVPPNSFALARSVEYFRIPRNVLTICVGKSTYARCGIITNVTPFEPEWEGHVTLEISNTTPLPARIYANEGICQVLFFEADDDDVCETSYADKAGKYQGQRGVTLPRL